MDYGKTTRVQDINIANAYQFHLPCRQGTPDTTVVDGSDNGADAALGANLSSAEIWANAGWATTIQSSLDESFRVPSAKLVWDMAKGQSLFLSFWTKSLDNTAQRGIFGTTDTTGDPGFRAIINTSSGQIRNLNVFDVDGNLGGGASSQGVDLTTANPVNTVFAIDGTAKTVLLWQNSNNILNNLDVSSVTGSTQPVNDISFGSDEDTNQTVGAQWRDIHALVWDGGMPSNIQEVVNRLFTNPFYPLSQTEFPL